MSRGSFKITANKGGERWERLCVSFGQKNPTIVTENPSTECFWKFVQIYWTTEGARVSHHQLKRSNTRPHPLFLNPPPLPPAGASQPPCSHTPHSQTRATPFISLCPSPVVMSHQRDEECLSVCAGVVRLCSLKVLIHNIWTIYF